MKIKKPITRKYMIIFIIIVSLGLGCLTGSLAALSLNGSGYTQIRTNVDNYMHGFYQSDRMNMFKESSFKYGKLFAVIWLMAFIPVGSFAVMLLMVFRGLSYGFTTTVLIRCYGAAGSAAAAILYIPQCLVLIPAYIFIAYSSIRFIMENNKSENKYSTISEYILILFLCCSCGVLAAFIDSFIVPGLISNFISQA